MTRDRVGPTAVARRHDAAALDECSVIAITRGIDAIQELARRSWREDQRRATLIEELAGPAGRRTDDGKSGRGTLERRQAERFITARRQQHVV
jgi:hypothetical protein